MTQRRVTDRLALLDAICTAPTATSHYDEPTPELLSFNSPLGACEHVPRLRPRDRHRLRPRHPGRGEDAARAAPCGRGRPKRYQRVPGRSRQVREEARHSRRRAVARAHRRAARAGSSTAKARGGKRKVWYGVARFFAWLESQGLQDARARAAVEVPQLHAVRDVRRARGSSPTRCLAARHAWRCGRRRRPERRFRAARSDRARRRASPRCPGSRSTISAAARSSARARSSSASSCRSRSTKRPTCCSARSGRGCGYLRDVGLGYLTLDRQSRTLSGGEVQRINLTTALGTSLVNTLFVLDEPSIGLHPRDMRPRDRRDAEAARRRQFAARRRARSADHARGRPHHRPRARARASAAARSCSSARPPQLTRDARIADRRTTSRGAHKRRPAAGTARGVAEHDAARSSIRGARRAQPEGHRRRRFR